MWQGYVGTILLCNVYIVRAFVLFMKFNHTEHLVRIASLMQARHIVPAADPAPHPPRPFEPGRMQDLAGAARAAAFGHPGADVEDDGGAWLGAAGPLGAAVLWTPISIPHVLTPLLPRAQNRVTCPASCSRTTNAFDFARCTSA